MIVSANGNPRHVFLDCGGHDGCSVRTFLKSRPDADRFEIYSFEPNARLAEYYAELPTTLIPRAVWIEDADVTLFLDEKDCDGSSLYRHKQNIVGGTPLTVRAIDFSHWFRHQFRQTDYIVFKLDTEGAEYRVLDKMIDEGAIDWVSELYAEFHWNKLGMPAAEHDVWPDVRGLHDRGWTGHGATMGLCPKHGYFSPRWQTRTPRTTVSKITALITPGYVMPRGVYELVRWSDLMRGWGATEAAVWVRAFCLNIDILHLCGPLARHLFRKTSPFDTPREVIWRNHAIVARTCFEEASWRDHWLPRVFAGVLSPATIKEIERCKPGRNSIATITKRLPRVLVPSPFPLPSGARGVEEVMS